MAEPTPRTKLTFRELLELPIDGKRHELIDGVHYMTLAAVPRHQAVLRNLLFLVSSHLEGRDLGDLYPAPLDVVLSEFDVVEPDLLFIRRENVSIVGETHLTGAPDLVVEILSSGTRSRDLGVKRDLYEAAGVGEYWIVDPEGETIEVLIRGVEGGFETAARLARETGDLLSTRLLPGFEAQLERIFA